MINRNKWLRIKLLLLLTSTIFLCSLSIHVRGQSDSIKQVTPKGYRDSIKEFRRDILPLFNRLYGVPEELKIKRNLNLLLLPVVSSSSDVGLALGGNAQGYWHCSRDLRNQISSARLTAIYTLYSQYSIRSFWNLSLEKDTWRVSGQANYNYFPLKYYGIGNSKNSEKETAEYISQDYAVIQTDISKRLGEEWFIGAMLRYSSLIDVAVMEEETKEYSNKEDNFLLESSPGNNGYSIFGIGFKGIRDTRDNSRYAYRGSLTQFSVEQYLGTHSFTNIILDYRRYLTIGKNSHLATMGYLNINRGDIPYREMPGMGKDFNDDLSVGRGYYRGRYIDKNLYYAQSEFRFPIFQTIRGVLFVGAGDIFSREERAKFESIKFNYGTGLRFPFDKEGRIYLRADLAFAPNEPVGFYLKLGEAF